MRSSHDNTVDAPQIAVAALYRFAPMSDIEYRRNRLRDLADANGVKGTLLLAAEGINGTIAGTRGAVDRVVAEIERWPMFAPLELKWSAAPDQPFIRLKVRIKPEIVTMGAPDLAPAQNAGDYIAAEDWNAVITDPNTVVVDTRNDYEVAIGTFQDALDPKTEAFTDFPRWVSDNLDPGETKRVAMFCTGGIRCEKATAYLKSQGFEDVVHLKGGILKYLETIPPNDSLWQGDCFVFDRRVSLGHGLSAGHYQLCSVCWRPFESGVEGGGYADAPCPRCSETVGPERLKRADERRRQIAVSADRGLQHIGPNAQPAKKRQARTKA